MRVGASRTKRSRGLVRLAGFVRDTRAGAVGVSSVLIALVCFTGTAMVSDHIVLLNQREILQAASASANIAVTRQMARLDFGLTDEELARELKPLARRYILANLPERRLELAKETLEIMLTPDRDAGVMNIEASVDLGGAIVGRYLWGRLVDKTTVVSGTELVVAPVELVLAVDVTGSMHSSIYAGAQRPFPEEDKRINVVRNALQVLVNGLYDQEGGQTGHVSVGLVPWNTTVNVGASRSDWVSDLGQGHKVIPPGFGPWRGCIEHRSAAGDLDLSLVLPSEAPFTSWFAPSTLEYRPAERAALAEAIGAEVKGENDWSADNPHEDYPRSPHHGCPRNVIIPPTTDAEQVKQAIADLQPWNGGGTMMHLGVVWGRRLLAPEWRSAWGLPEDEEESGREKILVLLSDGLNAAYDNPKTYPGDYSHNGTRYRTERTSQYTGYGRSGNGAAEEGYRVGTRFDHVSNKAQEKSVLNSIFLQSCDLAKDDGVTIFTVSAVPHGIPYEGTVRARLIACATSADHAFVENSEPERMEGAFRQIGRMVARIRRINAAI